MASTKVAHNPGNAASCASPGESCTIDALPDDVTVDGKGTRRGVRGGTRKKKKKNEQAATDHGDMATIGLTAKERNTVGTCEEGENFAEKKTADDHVGGKRNGPEVETEVQNTRDRSDKAQLEKDATLFAVGMLLETSIGPIPSRLSEVEGRLDELEVMESRLSEVEGRLDELEAMDSIASSTCSDSADEEKEVVATATSKETPGSGSDGGVYMTEAMITKVIKKTAEITKKACMEEIREVIQEQSNTIHWLTEEGKKLRSEVERLQVQANGGGRRRKKRQSQMPTDPLFDIYGMASGTDTSG